MNKTFTIILVLIIVVFGGYFIFNNQQAQAPAAETENGDVVTQNSAENVVTYTDEGYSPNTLTVKVGDTVTWKNESSSGMWTASAMHPTHTTYSGTSLSEHCPDTANTTFDECTSAQPGESWSFTFDKAGEWKYHNHVKANHFGTIVVEE